MEKVELKEPNIVGFRKKIATLLTSKPFDICHIVLIFIYTILVLVFLSLHDSYYDDHPKFELGFQLADLAILFIFC